MGSLDPFGRYQIHLKGMHYETNITCVTIIHSIKLTFLHCIFHHRLFIYEIANLQ